MQELLCLSRSDITTIMHKILQKSFWILLPLVLVLIGISNYLVFMHVPDEKIMGAVQRIFYFHVASATACYLAFAIVFASSLFYLVKKKKIFDLVNVSAAETGFLFCTIVLLSGMIWGKAAWNTWFRFEPRLISFLLIWLIFLAFNVLRTFGNREQIREHSAVLGILGAVSVPIMVYSVKLLPAVAQLHPQVVERQGLPPVMLTTMFFCMLSMIVLELLLISVRLRIELLKEK